MHSLHSESILFKFNFLQIIDYTLIYRELLSLYNKKRDRISINIVDCFASIPNTLVCMHKKFIKVYWKAVRNTE